MNSFETSMIPSIGGDVADLPGTLESLRTGEDYTGSLNPHGNPYEGKNCEEIVDEFDSVYGQQGIVILQERFCDLRNSVPDLFEESESVYNEALDAINRKPGVNN